MTQHTHGCSGVLESCQDGCVCTCHGSPQMTPTAHEKAAWTRLAHWAYTHGYSDIGHRYSMAAALATGATMPLATFDRLQSNYRAWLVFGTVPTFDQESQ